ncbi:MAG TPA: deoxyribose-phosphate aldolase [Bacilli bacterium]|jgi:deoxyribose-phosphate aldolase|nr:deoxyribose-phosphate aldolase [Bacilli bacterium]HQA55879.1 deoxyribose-phosphate aldolase [Bacilli bacterium]
MKYNKLIDHTILKPDATPEQIIKLCEEAKAFDFMSVCVNPAYVPLAHECLKGSDVKVCTVVGFPLGMNLTKTKLEETELAIKEGADEIDMVINIGMLKSGNDDYVEGEIALLKQACGSRVLKVIIETCLLTDDEKLRACIASKNARADFVKTSTGFSIGGATVHDVALMRKTVGPEMGVKASGGVKTHEDLVAMVEAGATRIGTSSGCKIV